MSLRDSFVVDTHVQEMSVRSSFHSIDYWAATFHDHLGTDIWFPLSQACFRELEGLSKSLESYLEAQHKTRCRIHWMGLIDHVRIQR
jgi:hypothetical protein